VSKVFFDVGISLDGFMAGENQGPKNPLGDNGSTIQKGSATLETPTEAELARRKKMREEG
jgi:hypothetical protein